MNNPTGMTEEEARMENDTPIPDRSKLEEAIKAAVFAKNNSTNNAMGRSLADEQICELLEGARWALHAIPNGLDFVDMCTQNPINQVYFRAGLLACREYMARFVEQGGDKSTATSIRANWWPSLGDDPGAPRLFNFEEVAGETPEGGFVSKQLSASVEALARAYQFLNAKDESGSPQIEYLHEKFQETGSGNQALAQIDSAISTIKDSANG